MPRMTARVHVDLLLSVDGRRTAAELTRRLEVSPASVSVAVNSLVQHGYVRRERDPQRRHDVYVVDDEAWYHSMVVSAQQTLEAAQAAMDAAEVLPRIRQPRGAPARQGGSVPGTGHPRHAGVRRPPAPPPRVIRIQADLRAVGGARASPTGKGSPRRSGSWQRGVIFSAGG
nr:MarR family transcriptional regulator [Streptomyces sp. NRRL S-515]